MYLINKYQDIKKWIIPSIIVFVVFVTVGILSYLYPYTVDDWAHLMRIGAKYQQPPSFDGVVNNIIWSYLHQNARIGEMFLFFVLYLCEHFGRGVWIIGNSITVIVFVSAMFYHIQGRLPFIQKDNNISFLGDSLLFAFLSSALFILLPVPGETIFWPSGTVNYMWMTSFTLWFLALYKKYLFCSIRKNMNRVKKVLMSFLVFLFGVCSGWGNENISPTLVVVLGVLLALHAWYCFKRKQNVKVWMYVGFIGFVIGTIFMLSAPGLAERTENASEVFRDLGDENYSSRIFYMFNIIKWQHLLFRMYAPTAMLVYVFGTPAICVFLYSLLPKMRKKYNIMRFKKELITACIYFITSLLGTFIFVFSSYYTHRVFFGVEVWLLISFLYLYKIIYKCFFNVSVIKNVIKGLFYFNIISALIVLYFVVLPSYAYFHQVEVANTQILRNNAYSQKDIVLDDARALYTDETKSFAYWYRLRYLVGGKTSSLDTMGRSGYYGLNSVVGAANSKAPKYAYNALKIASSVRRVGKWIYTKIIAFLNIRQFK